MRNWIPVFAFFLFFLLSLGSLVFSRNGLFDLFKLQEQMSRTRHHISTIESSNEELRRRIDLVRKKDQDAFEYRIRVQLGLLRPGEKLYLESGAVSENR